MNRSATFLLLSLMVLVASCGKNSPGRVVVTVNTTGLLKDTPPVPDEMAMVVLVPDGVRRAEDKLMGLPRAGEVQTSRSYYAKRGAYLAQANGGSASIEDVKPGKYTLIIIAGQKLLRSKQEAEQAKAAIGEYFVPESLVLTTFMMTPIHIEQVEVKSDKLLEVNHTFVGS